MSMMNTSPGQSELYRAALEANHPEPENARWGEVNVLELATARAGRRPTVDEARDILEQAERESDFNDLFR